MEWSDEFVLLLIEEYRSRRCLWDPKDPHFKILNKKTDAWNEIGVALCIPPEEAKKKMVSLLASFRRERSKEATSSGMGADQAYHSKWFAFKAMAFLLDKFEIRKRKWYKQSRSSEAAGEETVDEAVEIANYNSLAGSSTPAVSSLSTNKSKDKSRHRTASNITEQQMATAFGQLTNVLSQRQSCVNDEQDECDLYGKLLAKKLRELPKDDRKLMMYEIDGLFIKRIKQRSLSCETPSPQNILDHHQSQVDI